MHCKPEDLGRIILVVERGNIICMYILLSSLTLMESYFQDPDTVCQAFGVCKGDRFILQKMRLKKAKITQTKKLV